MPLLLTWLSGRRSRAAVRRSRAACPAAVWGRRTLGALLDAVRRLRTPVADDALAPSELVLRAPDASIDEVRGMLSDDGLIPS
ncbi:hypothetical protein ACIA8M_38040 [Streptomyces anulatus]